MIRFAGGSLGLFTDFGRVPFVLSNLFNQIVHILVNIDLVDRVGAKLLRIEFLESGILRILKLHIKVLLENRHGVALDLIGNSSGSVILPTRIKSIYFE